MEEIMNNNTEVVTEDVEVQEPVVEAQPEVEGTPVETVDEQPARPQTRAENSRQAAMRRSRENDLARQLEAARANENRLMEALKGYGYSGNAEEVADQIRAAQQGISYEEYQKQQEEDSQRLKAMMQSDPEFLAIKQKADLYEQEAFDRVFKDDLSAIKKAFPEVKAKTVEDLGDMFTTLRANGVDAVTAYAAIAKGQEATKKPVPPVMGAVNQTPAEKEFYTSEELDRLTDKDLDDPSVFARAMKSMTRLGRKK